MSTLKPSARLIAFYLPQYHPIPENDEWWGPGFTEWTNVAKARPLFRGHVQPHLPGELGFYDLRLAETRAAQAELARMHGIEGFCYWHYWLGGGRRLLERPFAEVLQSGEPDFPFCLGWANHSWTGVWFGSDDVLAEQTYPGNEDHRAHFEWCLPAFRDQRYIQVEGKPLFYIHRPGDIPELSRVMELWRKWAIEAGLSGMHLVGEGIPPRNCQASGFDASASTGHTRIRHHRPSSRTLRELTAKIRLKLGRPAVFEYADAMQFLHDVEEMPLNQYPCIIPNWDSTPRLGVNGIVLKNSHPELFREHLCTMLGKVAHKPFERRILFAKSWNEWAEGNYLEPDREFGRAFLEVIRDELLGSP